MPEYQKILEHLQNDYGMKDRGKFYREGQCPECNKKTLWISAGEPHHIKCGRENNCNWSAKTRDLYPELWKPLHEQYPPTKADPNATAKAYLRSRKLDPAIFTAEFDQGQRIEREAIREPKGTETVRFYLTADKAVWWERFIVPIETGEGLKKAHFNRSYKGKMWQPSTFAPEKGDQVFLTEGVLDALSLIQSGFQAVSLMSSNHWPEHALEPYFDKGIRWVIALDNDKAGQYYSRKYVRELQNRGEQVEVCLAPDQDKRDWNDLLQECGGKIRRHDLDEWFYAGRLLTATSASDKAMLIMEHTHKTSFSYAFADQLYFASYSEKEGDIKINSISNCLPEFLYFQKDAITDEGSYYLRVNRPGSKRDYKGVFAPSALASDKEFNQRLLNLGPLLMFTGTKKQLQRHIEDHWNNGDSRPEVQAINYVGYSKEFGGWLFPQQAVFDGKLHQVNNDDYFAVSDDKQVKTSFRMDTIKINSIEDGHNEQHWLDDFRTAFGVKGLAALAYWTGSFFAEQIRAKQASYPWLELSGDPGTGKSTLLEFLWKLTGRDNYEGIDLERASKATQRRTLEQYAGLPIVAIEGDHGKKDHQNTFLDKMKPTYNGRGAGASSYKNNGNETKEVPFRAALVIAQNAEVDSEKAIMERIVHIHWDKSHFNRAGYDASNRLRDLALEDINGFMTACITQEQSFLDKYSDGYKFALRKLEADDDLNNGRLRHNYAQIMGLAHALKASGILTGLSANDLEALDTYLKQGCTSRHQRLESDTPIVSQFWDNYHYLHDVVGRAVNHSNEPTRIAINMEDYCSFAKSEGLDSLDMTLLKKEVKKSKKHPYIEYDSVWSSTKKKAVKCFVFTNTETNLVYQVKAKAA